MPVRVLNSFEFEPVAAGRGIPEDASYDVHSDGGDPRDPAPGASWVLWSELDKINWEEHGSRALPDDNGAARTFARKETIQPSWEVLFKMMAALAKWRGEGRVRLVVWFDW